MAHVLPTSLVQASLTKAIAKNARLCQECGKPPVPFEETSISRGRSFGIGCPDRHSLIHGESGHLTPGDAREYYAALVRSIGPMIEAWNDKQEIIRNSQMFPGQRRDA